MTIRDILKVKGTSIFTIHPEATLADAAHVLCKHRVGSLMVCGRGMKEGECLVGIITERDLLYVCGSDEADLSRKLVSDVMTSKLITGSLEDSVEATMGLMTTNRIRHLPVLTDGRLVGLVSIGDVVKAQHDRLALENRFMKDYIQS